MKLWTKRATVSSHEQRLEKILCLLLMLQLLRLVNFGQHQFQTYSLVFIFFINYCAGDSFVHNLLKFRIQALLKLIDRSAHFVDCLLWSFTGRKFSKKSKIRLAIYQAHISVILLFNHSANHTYKVAYLWNRNLQLCDG